ncbi:hypothetical protein [Aquimarina sp. MAR_2010_214]|uniref:hypothetical protein n=1 Tax=Aquimarina sp. MAR_2010_214 TaxID=1250026 RepID=UPI001178A723|nr:hypothetical protein [Aquimarina sp. MAR_2010_214]
MIPFIVLAVSCDKKQNKELFEVGYGINEVIKNNEKCLRIFEMGYGVDSLHVKTQPYVGSLLNRYIEYNAREKQERVFFLRLDQSGEISESVTFWIRVLSDKAIITKYYYDEKDLTQTKTIQHFDMSAFEDFLNKNETQNNAFAFNKMLLIDIPNTKSCSCKFFGKINFSINDLKDLSLFDQFSD